MKQQAKWIWYDGDFELYHHMNLSLNRRERGSIFPTMWKVFDCHRLVRFEKSITLVKEETLHVDVDGVGYMQIGWHRFSINDPITLEPGEHKIAFTIGNKTGIPAIRVHGETIFSDETWIADALEGEKRLVGTMDLPEGMTPTSFNLPVERIEIDSREDTDKGVLYDFGRETFVKLVFDIPEPGSVVRVVYGESHPEAMSDDHSVIWEERDQVCGNIIIPATACRYARIVSDIEPENVYGLYEYLPLETRGEFRCEDELINHIYDVSEYTLRLNSRLFYLDGIKRDHWVWGGDAYQSFFLDYYIHFDRDIIKRTLTALRGGDPIVSHVNTIVDYSLYWLIALGDYILYTGDVDYVQRMYDRAEKLMEYCIACENDDGLLQGRESDWTFIDWADMEKNGALAAMQMLYCKALESMSKCAQISKQLEKATRYKDKAAVLRTRIRDIYWDEELGAYVTTFDNGKKSTQVRRHANIFALIFGFADESTSKKIIQNVILNTDVPAITTPYFKFYELEALCKAGDLLTVTETIRSYWGGMLKEGATTFWEEYDPTMNGEEHYAMYHQPYDKSLCHAWGASPIYLLGRYYLGVRPLEDGYGSFEVKPNPGGLQTIQGIVPIQEGSVTVKIEGTKVTITTDRKNGWFVTKNKRLPIIPGEDNHYSI